MIISAHAAAAVEAAAAGANNDPGLFGTRPVFLSVGASSVEDPTLWRRLEAAG